MLTEEENFVFLEQRGNYCYRKNSASEPMCSGLAGKGRTKTSDGQSIMPEDAQMVLDEFFGPFNQELYELVGEDYGW